TGQIDADPRHAHSPPPDELRVLTLRIIEAFETGRSPYMAESALHTLHNLLATKTLFTDEQRDGIREKLRRCIRNPDHAIHCLHPNDRLSANATLEFLFGQPDLLGAAGYEWIESVEQAIRMSDTAFSGTLE